MLEIAKCQAESIKAIQEWYSDLTKTKLEEDAGRRQQKPISLAAAVYAAVEGAKTIGHESESQERLGGVQNHISSIGPVQADKEMQFPSCHASESSSSAPAPNSSTQSPFEKGAQRILNLTPRASTISAIPIPMPAQAVPDVRVEEEPSSVPFPVQPPSPVKQEQVEEPSPREDVTVTSTSVREESGAVSHVEETSGSREVSIAESHKSYTLDLEPVVEDSIPSPKTDVEIETRADQGQTSTPTTRGRVSSKWLVKSRSTAPVETDDELKDKEARRTTTSTVETSFKIPPHRIPTSVRILQDKAEQKRLQAYARHVHRARQVETNMTRYAQVFGEFQSSGSLETAIAESYKSYTPDLESVVEDSIPSPKTDAVVVEESLSPRNISLAEAKTETGTGTSLQPIDESSGERLEDLNENTDKVSNLLFIYAYRLVCIPMLFKSIVSIYLYIYVCRKLVL
jgi:hypothetical protein